ncbi:MAG: diphosphomevalonate decarboxylase [Patescibacteria group bacterium]
MKATAIAPANIAFIKYWGKADDALRLPLNSSISMNLSGCVTTTTVEFSPSYREDIVEFMDQKALTILSRSREDSQSESLRVCNHLDSVRVRAGSSWHARVVTKNFFPKGAGIASSASGFAALTVAAVEALGLTLSEKELTIIARLGSGSACRSIPDGFVEWQKGKNSQTSFAYSLYPENHWDLLDIVVVVQKSQKKIGSTEGMDGVRTSPFLGKRIRNIPDRIKEIKHALAHKDIEFLGALMEEDCINMHAVAMTQKPPIYYWNGTTMDIIRSVCDWRMQGIPAYFTIDAGPNVHLICEAKDEKIVSKKASKIIGVQQIIVNKPAQGARLVEEHLF